MRAVGGHRLPAGRRRIEALQILIKDGTGVSAAVRSALIDPARGSRGEQQSGTRYAVVVQSDQLPL